jgi:polar amino acid transport system permease protein
MVTDGYQWDFSVVFSNAPALLAGLGVTLGITAYSILIGSALGALIAYAKGSRVWLVQMLANAFTDAFRAIPVLVMMIWLFYSFPSITLWLGFSTPIRLDPEPAAIAALAIYLAAQLADILRAGLDSIPSGQYDVAKTLGLSPGQIVSHIQVPQVLMLTLPAILGQYASTLLLSSLASVIAVGELLHQAQTIITNQYHALEVYTTIAMMYLAVAWSITYLAKKLGRKPKSSITPQENFDGFEVTIPPRSASVDLEVEALGYTSDAGVTILVDLNFTLERGSVLGIFGPSGAGKSTLVRLLTGLIPPSRGHYHWRRNNGSGESKPPQLGYVPQGLFLWPHLTASENVALALQLVGRNTRADARQSANNWLSQLGLAHRLDAKPATLSGGELQRVAIARALAVNPEVFLLDEITSSLDPELISQVIDILAAIVKSGAMVIIVSHNYGSVYSLIDKALFLSGSQQLDFGEKEAVFSGRIPRIRALLSRHAQWESLPQLKADTNPIPHVG